MNPEPSRDPRPRRRSGFSTQVDAELQARVRAAVRGVSAATGADYTLAQLTEDALLAQCLHLEATYNHHTPWPTPQAPLRPGQRIRTPPQD